MNGFESWRLLARRSSLQGTALDISLLTRILEFKFRTEQFEQDFSEWEKSKQGTRDNQEQHCPTAYWLQHC